MVRLEVHGTQPAFDLGRGRSLAEEISELAAESAVEDELAALKARLAKAKGAAKPAERE